MGSSLSEKAAMVASHALVWIDAREAVIVRIQGDRVRREHVQSEVPAHHRSGGHVRHDPSVRHGGASPRSAGESHRIEHLNRFVADIADRLAPDDRLLVVGPGTVHERLACHIAENDVQHRRVRAITSEAATPMTDRQLVARLRRHAGVVARQRSVGAYRWDASLGHDPSGKARFSPRRVVPKPPGRAKLEPED